jgi:hypothetical protein
VHDICVVYLARAQNGLEPVKTFFESYARWPAGIEHELLVIFKGFKDRESARPYVEYVQPWMTKMFFMHDFGFDLRAWSLALRNYEYPYFCFFNSFSALLGTEWLAKLYGPIKNHSVGLVGATGSCESMYSNAIRESSDSGDLSWFKRLQLCLRVAAGRFAFEPFPNYHIRTSGFIIARKNAYPIWPRQFLTKRSSYLFENGKNNLTRRLLRQNLHVQIVGRDGTAYDMENWKHSRTFRLGEQDNLLVADNQTRFYQSADAITRKRLTYVAWGF